MANRVAGMVRRAESAELPETRSWIASAFSLAEDVAYVGLGAILAVSALALLVGAAVTFVRMVAGGELGMQIVPLLDRLLLVLMIVEILYTVQVSFREHT